MTPKEKAIELNEKFMLTLAGSNGFKVSFKSHCLIAVDEVLKANHIWYKGSIPYNYWIEVKKEIEKL